MNPENTGALLQSQAMKLWDEADEEGRYWLMERQRCRAEGFRSALIDIRAGVDNEGGYPMWVDKILTEAGIE